MQEEYYHLNILPITNTTAALINVHSIDKDSAFAELPYYIGKDFCLTPNDLSIEEYRIAADKVYRITSIKESAFSHCLNLKTLRIGKYVETIHWNMYKCVDLCNIFVDKENKHFYDIDGVLFKGKELVAFPQGRRGSYSIPEGIKKIGNHAFKSCHLSEIFFPSTLEEIGNNAFYECKYITEFTLPESIKRVHFNNNVGNKPIKQNFYLSTDLTKNNPLEITDIIKLFPA